MSTHCSAHTKRVLSSDGRILRKDLKYYGFRFANRAKSIKNTPAVNAVATNASMIQTLTKQLSALKTQLESKKNVEVSTRLPTNLIQ